MAKKKKPKAVAKSAAKSKPKTKKAAKKQPAASAKKAATKANALIGVPVYSLLPTGVTKLLGRIKEVSNDDGGYIIINEEKPTEKPDPAQQELPLEPGDDEDSDDFEDEGSFDDDEDSEDFDDEGNFDDDDRVDPKDGDDN